MIFDNTAEAALSIWGDATASTTIWKPSETILLLTNPGYNAYDPSRKSKMTMYHNTLVEVDPAMYDAEWLRNYARKLSKRDHINPPFPQNGKIHRYIGGLS